LGDIGSLAPHQASSGAVRRIRMSVSLVSFDAYAAYADEYPGDGSECAIDDAASDAAQYETKDNANDETDYGVSDNLHQCSRIAHQS
jgi:hypothetical protein